MSMLKTYCLGTVACFFVFCLLFSCQQDKQKATVPEQPTNQQKKVTDLLLSRLVGSVSEIIEKTYPSPAAVLADLPSSITRTRFQTDGNIREMLTEMDNQRIRSYSYRYQGDSILVTNLLLRKDTVIDRKQFVYYCQKNGARIKMRFLDQNGVSSYSATIINNDQGLPIEYQHQVAKPELKTQLPCRELLEYNELGYLIQEQIYRFEPKTGQCIATNNKRQFLNDQRGNCTEESVVNANNQLMSRTRYRYNYDDRGNWTEKTAYAIDDNGKEEVRMVVLRSFTYFK